MEDRNQPTGGSDVASTGAGAVPEESEPRLRLLAEQLPALFWTTDWDLRLTSIRGASLAALGLRPERIVGRPLQKLLATPDTVSPPLAAHRRALAGATVRYQMELSGHLLECRLGPLRDPDGVVCGTIGLAIEVSEQQRSDEARLAAMVDAALDAIVTMDAAGVITSWTRHAEAMFGWPPQEIVGRTLASTIIPPRYREAHAHGLRHFLATGEGPVLNRRIEIEGLHRDGHEVPIELAISARAVGETFTFTAFVRDISERRRAEAVQAATYRIAEATNTTRDLPELFRAIHTIVRELMPAENLYIAVTDPATGMLSFPYFVDQHDPPPSPRPPGRGLTEWVLRKGQPLLATPEVFGELVARGEVDTIGAQSLDWVGVPLTTEGRTIGALVVQSYTEGVRYGEAERRILEFVSDHVAVAIDRKRSQEMLREREEQFRALIENSADAIALFDPDGRILYGSPATTRILGYSIEEFVGRNAFELIHAEDHAFVASRLEEALRKPADQVEVHARVHHKDGSWRVLEGIFTNLLADPSVGAIVNNYRDITERRRLEEQVQQAQKLQAVGRLAGGIAHDFNNLLTAIFGSADLLFEDLAVADPRRNAVTEIREAAERAAGLTRQLLAYSRKQVLQPTVLDLNTVVQSMGKLLRRLLGEDIEFHTALAGDLGPVTADPGQLEQVIVNLAVNARDAMPQGGKLTIETANAELDDRYTQEHSVVPPGRYVRLALSDTGVGMDAQTKAHLFEPFFTTKALGEGTGLGLATVYGIVKQSGGFIWVYSEPGQGTTFKIYFPRAADMPQPMAKSPEAPAASGGSETILLVEDEKAVRLLSQRVLRGRGYTMLLAGNGHEALEVVARYPGAIHLLVTDVVMPSMGGRELAERLAQQRPEIKVLFLSGYTNEAIVHHGVLEPGVNFLQKPFSPETLAAKVREVLDRHVASR